ncbi:hypothetical protein F4808DRAFT_470156 [Astrocystis sublimbata]|nr:hypothetical protein F4808DRAFT_470156 [Astrocystis sublimbata]
MGPKDHALVMGTSSPSMEAFNFPTARGKSVELKLDGEARSPSIWQHRFMSDTTTSRIAADGYHDITKLKTVLNHRLQSFKSSKHRRTRSVRTLLETIMFGSEIHMINPPEDTKEDGTQKNTVQQIKVSPPNTTGEHTRQVPAGGQRAPPYVPRRLSSKCYRSERESGLFRLDPIPELSPIAFTFRRSIIPKPRNIPLQSTPRAPRTIFRHGPIRLRKFDLVTEQGSSVTESGSTWDDEHALNETFLYQSSDSQKDEEFGEDGDLVEWWEAWGIENEIPPNDPLRPDSTASDNLPSVTYSDTTSEDSVSSCCTELGAREDLPQCCPHELDVIEGVLANKQFVDCVCVCTLCGAF